MRDSLIYLITLSIGIAIGTIVTWVNSYSFNMNGTNQQEFLEQVLIYSNVAISSENSACEGKPVKTVGAVIASLLELNKLNSRNMLSYGCYGSVCTMSVSNCKPWQDQECGSRFLKFDLNELMGFDLSSFSCFDMP